MAIQTVVTVDRAGVNVTSGFVAQGAAGDSFPNTGVEYVLFKNTSGGAITVTADIQATVDGQAVTDRTISVGATTGMQAMGPFPTNVYNDGNNRCNFTYSATTGLSILVLKNSTT